MAWMLEAASHCHTLRGVEWMVLLGGHAWGVRGVLVFCPDAQWCGNARWGGRGICRALCGGQWVVGNGCF